LVIVVDASVAVKWYFREVGSDAAQGLLDPKIGSLISPDLLLIEVCAAFVRGANVDKSRKEDAHAFIADFREKLDNGTVRTERLSSHGLATAATLALDLGHPLKDCLYLALAMELECELVTCDVRFAAKAKGVWDRVRVLGE
jgi:predicted nucleic acid-binding protein